jgi:hypothetical protein
MGRWGVGWGERREGEKGTIIKIRGHERKILGEVRSKKGKRKGKEGQGRGKEEVAVL